MTNNPELAVKSAGWRGAAAFLFLAAVSTAIFVPLRPSFPWSTALDNSWMAGLNEAAALGLSYGDEIVFTFGPYASIYTGEYHSATDGLALLGGAVLALGYAVLLTVLGGLRGFRWSVAIAVSLLVLFRQKDALLFAYPLLLTIYVYLRYLATKPTDAPSAAACKALLVLLLIPCGLLSLIKGTALAGSAAAAVLCAIVLAVEGRRQEAAICLLVPAAAAAVFWLVSGQAIFDLPLYLRNLAPIVSGYTPAMALTGPEIEIALYLAAAVLLLAGLVFAVEMAPRDRIFLTLAFALFLFLGFKAGFVRHDGHAIISAATIGIAGLAVGLVPRASARLVAMACFAAWVLLDGAYGNTSTSALVQRAVDPFVSLHEGVLLRWRGGRPELERIAREARLALSRECPIDKLDGAADIYSYRQACLIYSGNRWSPRPILQSYSAYTPRLARMNAEHLIGESAPRHVLFKIEPIDGRLPSLEDGLSWPLLLARYQPRRLDGKLDLAYLQLRNDEAHALPRFSGAWRQTRAGEDVMVPKHGPALMAQVELRPTLIGRLASIVFKTPAPQIQLKLASGAEKTYRFVPGMGAAGFLISPHVASTRDFVLLLERGTGALATARVESFRIVLGPKGRWFWSPDLNVRLDPADFVPAATSLTKEWFDQALESPPLGGKVGASLACEGNIDRMNGVLPVPLSTTSGPFIGLDGWTAVSSRTGELPEKVFVVVRDGSGRERYFPTRSRPRPDVQAHFKQPGLLDAGFEAHVDLSSIPGEVVQLQLAQQAGGRLIHCEPVRSVTVLR